MKKEKILSNGQANVMRIPNGPRDERLKRILKGAKCTITPDENVPPPVDDAFGHDEDVNTDDVSEEKDWPSCMRLNSIHIKKR